MSKRVLLADDDRHFMHTVGQRCRELGLHVEFARDGFHAACTMFLPCEECDRFDLFIIDVNMPGNGFSLCEEILQDSSLKNAPIIVLTGRDDATTIRRCEELGAAYVRKCGDYWPTLERLLRDRLNLPSTEPRPCENGPAMVSATGFDHSDQHDEPCRPKRPHRAELLCDEFRGHQRLR